MSEKVTNLIKQKVKNKIQNEKRSNAKEQRITVVLSDYDLKRLDFLVKYLGDNRGSFLRELILSALDDIENETGLKGWETSSEPILDILLEDFHSKEEIEEQEKENQLRLDRYDYKQFVKFNSEHISED